MSSDAETLSPAKSAEPSQKKNTEGYTTKLAVTTIVTVVGKFVGERCAGAFNPSDESAKWMEPYLNATLCLGTLMIISGFAVMEKKPPFVSKLMMIVGAALTTAAIFAPVVALLQPPVAIAFTVVVTSIFAATAVMLCRG